MKNKDSAIRVHAAKVLSSKKSLNAEAEHDLVILLNDKDSEIRFCAAEVLSIETPRREAADLVLVTLLNDKDSKIRFRAVEILSTLKPLSDVTETALVTLLKGKDIGSSYLAAEVLSRQKQLSAEAEHALVTLLNGKDMGRSFRAAEVLSSQKTLPEAAEHALITLLKNKNPIIRVRAAEVLSRHKPLNSEAEHAIAPLLTSKDPRIRVRTAEVLSKHKPLDPETEHVLVPLLADKDQGIRSRAAKVLCEQQPLSKTIERRLVNLLDDEESPVRFFAAQALAKTLIEAQASGLPEPSWIDRQVPAPLTTLVPNVEDVNENPISTLGGVLSLMMNGSKAKVTDLRLDLERLLSSGGGVSPAVHSELMRQLSRAEFTESLLANRPGPQAVRDVVGEFLVKRLHDLHSRSKAGAPKAWKRLSEFVTSVPEAVLPRVASVLPDDADDKLKHFFLDRLVLIGFDGLPPEMQRETLGLYDRFAGICSDDQRETMLRRMLRSCDADVLDTRKKACRSLAVLLPELKGVSRKRCFNRLLDVAISDEAVADIVVDAFKMVYGSLRDDERRSLGKENIL